MSDLDNIWLFVNHLGEFRYVTGEKPSKVYVYEKVIHHSEKSEIYHGSWERTVNFYMPGENKIYYYGYEQKDDFTGEFTINESYFTPEIIGTVLPFCFVPVNYINMNFNDEPVLFRNIKRVVPCCTDNA